MKVTGRFGNVTERPARQDWRCASHQPRGLCSPALAGEAMPAHRMNMRMIKDVLLLKFDAGFSHDRSPRIYRHSRITSFMTWSIATSSLQPPSFRRRNLPFHRARDCVRQESTAKATNGSPMYAYQVRWCHSLIAGLVARRRAVVAPPLLCQRLPPFKIACAALLRLPFSRFAAGSISRRR